MRSKQLASRLEEVLLNGKWIAQTNFIKQISNLNLAQATQKIANLNTIALLTFHINYYTHGMLEAFNTNELRMRDKYSFDMPKLKTEDDWQSLISSFEKNSKSLVKMIEQFSDDQLDMPFFDKKYGTIERNINGIIEHAYYHLGQVSLICKLI